MIQALLLAVLPSLGASRPRPNAEMTGMLQTSDMLHVASHRFVSIQCDANQTNYLDDWPRFNDKADLKGNREWGKYISSIYGELPEEGYPICTYNLAFIDPVLFEAAGLHRKINRCSEDLPSVPCPAFIVGSNDGTRPECLEEGLLFDVPAYAGASIFNARNFLPVPSNAWVEVVHKAVPNEEQGSFWMYRATGSGIWYNTRKTLVLKNHEEGQDWMEANGGKRSKGYREVLALAHVLGHKSVQYTRHADRNCGARFGAELGQEHQQDQRAWAIELVDLNPAIMGLLPCGGEKQEGVNLFRVGWRATRHCHCRNDVPGNAKGQVALNCVRQIDSSEIAASSQTEESESGPAELRLSSWFQSLEAKR